MRKFIIFLGFFIFFLGINRVSAFDVPNKPVSFVNDYAKVLSENDKTSLENKISNFEKETSNEIAVVIIPSLDGDVIENVAQDIFTKWGIGKKDKNNGVLILIAMEERKTRIHTGYGVEGDLTDLGTSYIQSEIMTPAFREENYYLGIDGAIDKMIGALSGNNIVPENYTESKSSKTNWQFIFIIIIVAVQWLIAILGRSKSWWAGGVIGAVVGGLIWIFGSLSTVFSEILFVFLIIFGLGFDYVVSKTYQKVKGSGAKHYPWWIGGGGHGGSSGGGFGGFGGGFSGGGGSSGSW